MMLILDLPTGYKLFIETEEIDPLKPEKSFCHVSVFAEGKFPGYPACDRKKCYSAGQLTRFIALYNEA
jgi:hypothetical protein